MKIFFPSILRKALPILCLLAPSTLLTGCGPDSTLAGNETLFPSAHTASYAGAAINPPAPDRRFHQRPARVLQAGRNAQPQGPVAIN